MSPARPASPLHLESIVVSAGRPSGPGRPINTPMVPASNFVSGPGRGREYSRQDATDGWEALEAAVGELEGGEAVSFASGMAAITAILELIPPGATIVAPDDLYQGVAMVLADGSRRLNWSVVRLPVSATQQWLEAIPTADFVWLESPSNPLLDVADVPQICAAAVAANVPVAVDNTFATPLLQRPLAVGATFSVHSATKFIGGHSDLLAGIVVTASPTQAVELRRRRTLGEATPGTLEAFLARGLRTMAIRLERAQDSALTLAHRLEEHRVVTKVRYPGLESHPGHDLAAATMNGPGAIFV
ncbi:MAG: aminotransferase class I/II-fold pyridoxal phosphate-dependent enzyme [Acidimicrobiales bacterium]